VVTRDDEVLRAFAARCGLARRFGRRFLFSISCVVLGILGGVVGGWVFGMLGIWPGGGIIGSIIVAFVGAVILVWLSRLVKKA